MCMYRLCGCSWHDCGGDIGCVFTSCSKALKSVGMLHLSTQFISSPWCRLFVNILRIVCQIEGVKTPCC